MCSRSSERESGYVRKGDAHMFVNDVDLSDNNSPQVHSLP